MVDLTIPTRGSLFCLKKKICVVSFCHKLGKKKKLQTKMLEKII
jgi:hypothetical protein